MLFISKYFAGIGFIFSLLNILFLKRRIKKYYQVIDDSEEKRFVNFYIIYSTFPYLLVQIFQLLGNYKTVFYIFLLDFNNVFYILGFISFLLLHLPILYLILFKNGAEVMVKYEKVFGSNFSPNKKMVKIFYTFISIIGILVIFFGNKMSGGAFSQIEEFGIFGNG
ncbi:MAG: hypothetical protein FWD28_01490 [Treponema sp.]|nr:hypothetical protein [Treponema sp.]